MITTSALFKLAVRSSHSIANQAILLTTPGTQGVITTSLGTALKTISGTVTLDSLADIRGTLDLSIAATWPTTISTSQVLPYGSEVSIARGIKYGNGNLELVQLGIFRIDVVEEAARGVLQVTAYDRSKGLQDARLLTPVQFDSTFTYGTALSALVLAVYPGCTITWDDTAVRDTNLSRSIAESQDRLGIINEIVTAAGKVWFFNNLGSIVVRTPPTATSASQITVNAGPGGILVSTDRRISREGVYNAIIASSEAIDSNAPVQGYAVDNNPISPTYFYGPYGQVPEYFSSPLLTTVAQCQTAAAGLLAQVSGLPYSVDFTSVPDPSYEPLDVATVTFPVDLAVSTSGRVETHIISSLSIPLGVDGGALQARTRLQQAIAPRLGVVLTAS